MAFLNVCAVWTCGFCVYKHGGKATPVLCRPIVLYGVCLQFRIVSHIYCHQYSRIVSSISAIIFIVSLYSTVWCRPIVRPVVPYCVVLWCQIVSAYSTVTTTVMCRPIVPYCIGL